MPEQTLNIPLSGFPQSDVRMYWQRKIQELLCGAEIGTSGDLLWELIRLHWPLVSWPSRAQTREYEASDHGHGLGSEKS